LGYEISRIANFDMVTLALIQGVVNTFVIFFAKLFCFFVDRVLLKNDGRNGIGISNGHAFAKMFTTHPPPDELIAALRYAQNQHGSWDTHQTKWMI